jgi:hypothetical protein
MNTAQLPMNTSQTRFHYVIEEGGGQPNVARLR